MPIFAWGSCWNQNSKGKMFEEGKGRALSNILLIESHIWPTFVRDLFWQIGLITCAKFKQPMHLEMNPESVPREQWLINIVCYGRGVAVCMTCIWQPSLPKTNISTPLKICSKVVCLKQARWKEERKEGGREGGRKKILVQLFR